MPSDNSNHEELQEIFLKAVELEAPEERAAFLAEACGEDSGTREAIESLLKEYEEGDGGTTIGGGATGGAAAETLSEKPGTMIGRYKLLQKIGEGGFGVVWMAEQTEPVVRRVALKVIKLGMDTKEVIARFEAERQALAMMEHPNIAKVLDAGATNTGRPYFAMELVKGVPITHYCDKNKLSARQRLELFVPVCQAIQHAHQKGVIHRDIKPSNVMVTLHDGVPITKVIDFGIAKAINQRLTEKTLFTNYAQMIGTPAYMSPEQAEMSGLDIDTRSDIYSLGVLLYELLTATTPFQEKELLSLGYGEMQRIITEKEPPRPSTRVGTMQDEELTVVAKNRNLEASAIRQLFRGELDWIVMKTLEKDRTRRYETANALRLDVERYLNDETVSAVAPSRLYRAGKFFRKHRGWITSAAAMVVVLLAALVFSAGAYFRERRARLEMTEAQGQRELAKAEAASEAVRADKVVDFLDEFYDAAVPELASQGHLQAIRNLLEVSENAASKLGETPQSEAEIRSMIADAYGRYLRNWGPAYRQWKRIEELSKAGNLAGNDTVEAALIALRVSEAGDRGVEVLAEVAENATKPGSLNSRRAASALAELSSRYAWYDREEAEKAAKRCLLISPVDADHAEYRFRALRALCICRDRANDWPGSIEAAQQALEMLPELPPNIYYREKQDIMRNYARAAAASRKVEEFRDWLRKLEPRLQDDVGTRSSIQMAIGEAYARRGDWEEGYRLIREGAETNGCTIITWYVAMAMADLMGDVEGYRSLCIHGLARFGGGANNEGSRRLYEALADVHSGLYDHPLVDEYRGYASSQFYFPLIQAYLDYRHQNYEEAEKYLKQFLDSLTDRTPGPGSAYFLLASIKARFGKMDEALEAYRKGLPLASPSFLTRSEPFTGTYWDEGVYMELDRREAATLLDEAGYMAEDKFSLREGINTGHGKSTD